MARAVECKGSGVGRSSTYFRQINWNVNKGRGGYNFTRMRQSRLMHDWVILWKRGDWRTSLLVVQSKQLSDGAQGNRARAADCDWGGAGGAGRQSM